MSFDLQAARRAGVRVLLIGTLLGASSVSAVEPGSWLEVRTNHFSVFSNAEPERAVEIARELELFRSVLGELSSGLDLDPVVPTSVIAFRDAEAFAPYRSVTGSAGDAIQGQYLSRPEVAFLSLNSDVAGASAFEVAYHEFVHDMLRRNLPQIPAWFEEGLAEYYSSFSIVGDAAVLGRPIRRHVDWWRRSGGSVEEVLSQAVEGSGHDGGPQAQSFYSVSWALVHYLFSNGADRSAELADYLARLIEGQDPARAFRDAFSMRLDQLDELLARHVLRSDFPVTKLPLERLSESVNDRSARWLTTSEVHVLLGQMQVAIGRTDEARDHFQEATLVAPDDGAGYAGLAATLDLEGRLEEAALLYADALSRGTNDALTLYRFARNRLLLAQSGAADLEGRRQRLCSQAVEHLSQAVAAFPRYAEAQGLAGSAHLLGSLEPQQGIRFFERAQTLIPDRVEWTVQQIHLLLRQRNLEAARKLVYGKVRRLGGSELFDTTLEQIDRVALVDAAEKAFLAGDFEEGLLLYDQAIDLTREEDLRGRMELELERLRLTGGLEGAG